MPILYFILNLDAGGGGGVIQITVPDLAGLDYSAGATVITDLGLLIYANASAYSTQYGLNQIMDQSPAAGEVVDIGTTVFVTVSLGAGTLGEVSRMRFKPFYNRMRFKVI